MNKFRSLLFSLLFLLPACKEETHSTVEVPIDLTTLQSIAESNQSIGWHLFRQEQLARPGENILISPLSIQTALQMAANGAQGTTLSEIMDVLDLSGSSVGAVNALHRDLSILLTQQSGHPEISVANRYFFDSNRLQVRAPFTDSLADYYTAGNQDIRFDEGQAALNQINGWVKSNTKGKIDKIVDVITPLDVAFLINALYFKADWATGFNPNQTHSGPFTLPDGNILTADYVNADRNFTFTQTTELRMVDIPFRDSTFAFSLLQPAASNSNLEWHLEITPEKWRSLYVQSQYERAMVSFPRLKLAYKNDLVQSLINLGMQTPFSETGADFSAMGTATNRIFIKQIAHKAVLEVDEKGAEGAAVTSIGFVNTSLPPVFSFNRPFVLVLRHVPTQTIMFLGYVTNPQKE
jgi:serpin B